MKNKKITGWTVLKPDGDMWIEQLWPTRTAAIFYLVNFTNSKKDYLALSEKETARVYKESCILGGWRVVKATLAWK